MDYNLTLVAPLISHRADIVNYVEKFKELNGLINEEDRELLKILDAYDNYGEWVVNNANGRVDGSSTFFVYSKVPDETCDEIVGNLNVRFDCKLADECGNIGYAVRPDLRGCGIGSKMLEAALAMCQMLGKEEVTVVTGSDNLASRRILEKNGFSLTSDLGDRLYYKAILK